MSDDSSTAYDNSSEIAIIGMAGRFPGAANVDAFWRNLCDGVESIARFSDDELKASGVSPALFSLPNYVRAAPIVDDIETFDAAFFGYSPREAELIDPQQRLFLECAWEALEHAGYDSERYPAAVGVFGGAKTSTYLFNLFANHDLIQSLDIMDIGLGNDAANLTTRVAYKLNLKGPSYSVHTACSTSLIAVHLACQSLLIDECQLALAGGVAVNVPHKAGYVYQPGGILSPDGHCRPFDATAQGTLFGSGVGVVVLKRLGDAIADGDNILAVIKGTASNNDGSRKASFTAPGVEGQTRVVMDALANAMVAPAEISYVEAHGTGTLLGDAIEIRALKRAYRTTGAGQKQRCAIGSVKSNVGHLDTAAGIASLIKAVLALQHKRLPPSLHYAEPNPQIDFGPFYVNTQLTDWPADNGPRRAGVSSFGFGSANAHAILEEAPQLEPSSAARPYQLLLISAQTDTALDSATRNLIAHFKQHPHLSPADVSYTLQVGRRAFSHRRMVVARGLDEAAGLLATLDGLRVFSGVQEVVDRPVAFMFTGQGSQYPTMGQELYETERVFRETVDQCAELLKPHLGLDLRNVVYPQEPRTKNQEPRTGLPEEVLSSRFSVLELDQTWLAQPALFVVEYALARLWMAWGVRPQAMIGHSIGEYVAACLAGVLALEEALELVAVRGRLMQSLPAGAMLAVSLDEAALQPFLGNGCSLAAVNAATLSVVSGPVEAIEALQQQLDEQGINCRRLRASHAFHSSMMDAILEPFTAAVRQCRLKPPQIPYISNVTGTWIEAAQATDPTYWADHLRRPVRFAQGVRELAKEPERVLLEVGPGQTLSTFARQVAGTTGQVVLSSLRHPQEAQSDVAFILSAVGRLWLAGVEIDWTGFCAAERRRRVPLPTYPFERQRFWVEPQNQNGRMRLPGMAGQKNDIAEWFYLPSWKRAPALPRAALEQPAGQPGTWVLFADASDVGQTILRGLRSAGREVVLVVAGEAFQQTSEAEYTIHPSHPEDYQSLCDALFARPQPPTRLVHCWSLSPGESIPCFDWVQERGFYSLLYLAQALGAANVMDDIRLDIVSDRLFSVTGEESLQPEKATLLGPCMVIPQEYPNLTCHLIDITGLRPLVHSQMAEQLLAEIVAPASDLIVSLRGKHRWVQTFDPQHLESAALEKTRLRPGGVYLITGGLGEIGLILAEALARTVQARLVLIGRSAFPARAEWEHWLATHPEDDRTSRRILKLREIEAHGGEVLILRADIADAEQTGQAVEQASTHFGQLHGVIHAAGLVGEQVSQFISETRPSQAEDLFHAKIHGLVVLERVLHGRTLDFGIVISSLATVLGGLGAAAYAAANAFMDAFVQRQQDAATPWLSINWDAWKLGKQEERDQMLEAFVNRAILPDEGAEAFLRILTLAAIPQVVVSTTDLHERIGQWIRREGAQRGRAVSGTLHARPNLPVAYAAPRNEFEQNVATVWQQVLGIEQVGINDSFFELGGHSLLITQLLNRLHKIYPIELSMRSLFENPTVAGMAQVIERMYQETGGRIKPILERFREAAPTEQQQMVETYIQHSIAQSLNLAPEDIGVEEQREEFGVEIVIGNLQWEFRRDFRLQLYPSEIRAHKTVRDLATFVVGELNRLAALRNIEATAPIALYEHYEPQVVAQPARINSWIKPEQKNERMVFLHSSPRAGSTLLRVMLAGHPDLFCPPELDILRCNTVSEWTDSLTDPTSAYGFIWATQGLEWALIELTGLDAESVRLYIRGMADDQVAIQEVYAKLQELASPRMLVDKTPQYSLRLETLLRAEDLFESPKHILLVRHPYSVIESLARIRLDKLFGPVIYGSDQVNSHVVAEKVWVQSYQNVLEFAARVSPERCHFVRYEDVVGDPRATMTALCKFLEIPFDEAVLQPYDNKSERMITGIGDPNIIYHDRIDPKLGTAWQRIKLPHLLGEPARELALRLGYELPAEADAGMIPAEKLLETV